MRILRLSVCYGIAFACSGLSTRPRLAVTATTLLTLLLSALWFGELLRGRTFWIPVRWQAGAILFAAVLCSAVGQRLAGVAMRPAVLLVAVVAFAVVARYAEQFGQRPTATWTTSWRGRGFETIAVGGVLVAAVISVGVAVPAAVGSAAIFVWMAFPSLWWGNVPNPTLFHASLDLPIGRLELLAEGLRRIRAVGLKLWERRK